MCCVYQLAAITVSDDLVYNIVIDQVRPESQLLAPNQTEAEKLLTQQGNKRYLPHSLAAVSFPQGGTGKQYDRMTVRNGNLLDTVRIGAYQSYTCPAAIDSCSPFSRLFLDVYRLA
jgi:hypothetical protein